MNIILIFNEILNEFNKIFNNNLNLLNKNNKSLSFSVIHILCTTKKQCNLFYTV